MRSRGPGKLECFRGPGRNALVLPLLVALSGCASFSYLADDGSTHVIGFVHVVQPPVPEEPSLQCGAGSHVAVQVLGLTLLSTPDSTGLTLGYAREEIGVVRMEASPEVAAHILSGTQEGETHE